MYPTLIARTLLATIAMAACTSGQAATLYLCKAYAGGLFWSNKHCAGHNAMIERMANVPDGLPFDQQVALAQQQASAASQAMASSPPQRDTVNADTLRRAECKALDARVAQLDAQARQAMSGQEQDRNRAERKAARDRQVQLKCGS